MPKWAAGSLPCWLGRALARHRRGLTRWHFQAPSTKRELIHRRSLESHQRQGAVDTWRTQFTGVPVQVWRCTVPKGETLIVDGTWHESHRPG